MEADNQTNFGSHQVTPTLENLFVLLMLRSSLSTTRKMMRNNNKISLNNQY